MPLITASILSKKLAAGLEALVLDVKVGNGAFMDRSTPAATELAESLVDVANGAGLKTTAIITDMNEPLASAAGNAVEVANAVEFLTGAHRDHRLEEVVLSLGRRNAGVFGACRRPVIGPPAHARPRWKRARRPSVLPAWCRSSVARRISSSDTAIICRPRRWSARSRAREPGYVQDIDTRGVGLAVVALGGGRTRPQDDIDPVVGFTDLAARGTRIGAGDVIAKVHARDATTADAAEHALLSCYHLSANPPDGTQPIVARIETVSDEE